MKVTRKSLNALLIVLLMCTTATAQFNNKTEALQFLNNSNLWVGGMPTYDLDNGAGIISIALEKGSYKQYVKLDLAQVQFNVKKNNAGQFEVIVKCKAKECLEASLSNVRGSALISEFILIMHSTFDNGNDREVYEEKYAENSDKIVSAFEYLQRFYK